MITAMRANNLRFSINEDIFSFLLGWFAHKILDELYNYLKSKFPKRSPGKHYRMLGDIVISVILFITSFPVLIIVAMIIRLRVSGRIITTTRKIKMQGKSIKLYKFNCPEDKVGKIIKSVSLHMLPHLFNYLKGDISISTEIPNAIRFFGRKFRS